MGYFFMFLVLSTKNTSLLLSTLGPMLPLPCLITELFPVVDKIKYLSEII